MTTRILVFVMIALIFSSQTFASTGLLRVGSRGSAVANLQTKLNELGFNAGSVDGIFGNGTRAAVIRFQRANKLAPDGIAGPATMAKLKGVARPIEPSQPKPNPPATDGQAPITQTLRQGSRGDQVKILQQKLNELGFSAGSADGIFGSGTRAAVIRFQRANGLSVDGILGPASIGKLYPAGGATPKPEQPKPDTPSIPITQTLRQGSRGDQVKILQQKLNELGFSAGSADGIFGSGTKAAVIRFQRANGLAVDGIVGPASIGKLYPSGTTPEPEKPKPEDPKPDPKPDPDAGFKEFNGVPGDLAGKTVILDPGHGGSDTGASRNGIHEKDFNINMSLRLKRMLEQGGAKVLITRTTDTYSYLYYRSSFVNKYILGLELTKQQEQFDALQSEVAEMRSELAVKESELAAEEKERNKAENDLEELDYKNKLKELESQLAELQETTKDINDGLNEKLAGLKADLNGFNEELEGLNNNLSSLNHELEDLLIQSQNNQAEIIRVENEIENLPEDSGEIQELQEELDQLNVDKIVIKEQKDTKEGLIKLEEEKIATKNSDISAKTNEIADTEQDIINTNQPVIAKESEIEALKAKYEGFKNALQESTNNINKLTGEIPVLEKTIADKQMLVLAKDQEVKDLELKAKEIQWHIERPANATRAGIYLPSATVNGRKTIGNKLEEIFDLTRNGGYENDIVFISVHCNATGTQTTTSSGVQVYYRSNGPNTIYGNNYDYYRNYNDAKRLKLANSMLKNTRENTNFKGTWSQPFRKDFHVLREMNLPSVLMEIGFVNNPEDRKLLQQEQTMENAAKGMYLGLVDYFR